MSEFLSEDWLAQLEELRAAAGAVEVPDELAGVVVNVTVRGGPAGAARMALIGGTLAPGHRPEATTTLILRADLARRYLLHGDQLAGLQGFMSGLIRVEGDTGPLKALRTAQPTASQLALRQKIASITD